MEQITDRDKILAAAVNVSSIFFPYTGPIVGVVVGMKMPYVKFHAYRCLIGQIVTSVIIGTLMIISLSYSIYTTYQNMGGHFDLSKIDWFGILIKSAITWVLLAIWNLINIIFAVKDALEAFNGKIPLKPNWIGKKAMKWSRMNQKQVQPIEQNTVQSSS